MMSAEPRRLLGIPEISMKKGAKADIILVDTEMEWTVDPEKLHSKSHNTVFKGEKFKGQNLMTITDGIIRFER